MKTLSILLAYCAVIYDALMFVWKHFSVCVQCAVCLEINIFEVSFALIDWLIY